MRENCALFIIIRHKSKTVFLRNKNNQQKLEVDLSRVSDLVWSNV